MARKAVLGQSLEQESGLLILPLVVALGRIVGTPGQRTSQKPEALGHLLAMRVEVLSVLGEGLEHRLEARALRGRLKLLGIETPGKDAGQYLEERMQDGLDTPTLGSVLRHHLPAEKERQEHEKQCKNHRALPCVHGLCSLSSVV